VSREFDCVGCLLNSPQKRFNFAIQKTDFVAEHMQLTIWVVPKPFEQLPRDVILLLHLHGSLNFYSFKLLNISRAFLTMPFFSRCYLLCVLALFWNR
jgi:hypothetical protein